MTDGITLWICREETVAGSAGAAALELLLDPGERARRSRFRVDPLARQYTLAHGLLRLALSRKRPEVAPADWRFVAGPGGKPETAPGLPPLAFSLAHTRGLVALAVGGPGCGPLGIDAEAADRAVDPAVADRFFAPEEALELRVLPGRGRSDRFFALWSLKESFLKATGLGLALPLDAFSFAFPQEGALTFSRHRQRVPGACRHAPGVAGPLGPGGRDYGFLQVLLEGPAGRHALALCLPCAGRDPASAVEMFEVEGIPSVRPDGREAPDAVLRRLDGAWDRRTP